MKVLNIGGGGRGGARVRILYFGGKGGGGANFSLAVN